MSEWIALVIGLVAADAALGIAAGDTPPPDDATVKRWIEEHRLEKYG